MCIQEIFTDLYPNNTPHTTMRLLTCDDHTHNRPCQVRPLHHPPRQLTWDEVPAGTMGVRPQGPAMECITVPPPAPMPPRRATIKSKRPFVRRDDRFIVEVSLGSRKDKKSGTLRPEEIICGIVEPPLAQPRHHGFGDQQIPIPTPAPMAPPYDQWEYPPPPAYHGEGHPPMRPQQAHNAPHIVQAAPPDDGRYHELGGDPILRAQIERERAARQAARNAEDYRRQAERELQQADRHRRRAEVERERAEADRRHARRTERETHHRDRHAEHQRRDERERRDRHHRRSQSVVVNYGSPNHDIIDVVDYEVGRRERRSREHGGRHYDADRRGMMGEEERLAREAARLLREADEAVRERERRRRRDRDGWRR